MILHLLFALGVLAQKPGTKNMNGKYSIASGGKQNVGYNDDYASKGYEYFDVWSPELATHYGEVFWTSQGNHPLPQDIIDRFAGKVMAIVGYEQDQVMVTPVGQPGVNPDQDVSVPINWAYNHHYMAWMTGKYSEMREVNADPNDVSAHGSPTKWIAVDLPNAADRVDISIPTSQMFSEGNGGESRRSYHGYPNGFAQLIESPDTWTVTPMQIDTRNRDCGVTPADVHNCTQFTPGPEPLQARYGRGIPAGTNYSGILECPCNSRFGGDPGYYPNSKTKVLEHKYYAMSRSACQSKAMVWDSKDCFEGASSIGINATMVKNSTVNDQSLPAGCYVVNHNNGVANVYYNQAKSNVDCGTSSWRSGEATSNVGVTLGLNLTEDHKQILYDRAEKVYCTLNHEGVLGKFVMNVTGVAEANKQLSNCEAFCAKHSNCWGCSADCSLGSMDRCQWMAIPNCGARTPWKGLIKGDVSQKVNPGNVSITLSGPADVWYGVGFDAVQMADQPWTLIVNSSGIFERKIGTCGTEADHCAGDQLETSVKVVSHEVKNGTRTLVVTRPLKGLSPKYYSFSMMEDATINLFFAVGATQNFGYHKSHAVSVMTLTTDNQPTCICDGGATGKLCSTGGIGCIQFVKTCEPAPFGDLLAQKNPTCNSRQYGGGLQCCSHKRILQDSDQEIRPELLRYHMKFRFWFQDYTPASSEKSKPSHFNLPRIYYQTEAWAGEYDIPPAFAMPGKPIPGYPDWPENKPTPGTSCTGTCPGGDDCQCVHTITYHWTVSNMRLIYAGGHCHAPSCISIELYKNDTGKPELLCRQVPVFGKGNFPVDKFDEAGYIALPPCLWGDDDGLEPSVFLGPNTPLFSIKKNHNTHVGHYGEMASWQMRGVYF